MDFFLNNQQHTIDISDNHLFLLSETQWSEKFEERIALICWLIITIFKKN